MSRPDWPENVPKPELPPGYGWVCLGQFPVDSNLPHSSGRWWVRLNFTFKTKHGIRCRHLPMRGFYFESPEMATDRAANMARIHYARRQREGKVK